MMQMILSLMGIALATAMLYVGQSYLSDVSASRHAADLESNIIETTRAVEKAFLECRRNNECVTESLTGSPLAAPVGADTRPPEVVQLATYLGFAPSNTDELEYAVRFTDGGRQLTVCINPRIDSGAAAFAKPYIEKAFQRLGGPPVGSVQTNPFAGLTGFTYRYDSSAGAFSSCEPLTVNAELNGNFYMGASRVFIDY